MDENIMAANGSDLANTQTENNMAYDTSNESLSAAENEVDTNIEGQSENSPKGAANTESEDFEKESTKQAFSRRLEQERAKIRAEMEKEFASKYAGSDTLFKSLKELGYEGENAEELALYLEADLKSTTYEDLIKEKAAKNKDIEDALKNHPDIIAAQQAKEEAERLTQEVIFKQDIEAINKAFPEAKIKSIDDLGKDFAFLMSQDKYSAEQVYAGIKAMQDYGKKPIPPSMGSMESETAEASIYEKGFMTSKEYDILVARNPKLLNNKKFMDISRKSMSKW